MSEERCPRAAGIARVAELAQKLTEFFAREQCTIDEGVLAMATALEALAREGHAPEGACVRAAVEAFTAEVFDRSQGPH